MSWLSRSGSRPPIERRSSPTRPPSLFVVRSSDGAEFPLAKDDFRNIATVDELRFNLLAPLLSIPPDCLIVMNEEGSPLNRDESVQHLALLAGTPASSAVLPPSASGAGAGGAETPMGASVAERMQHRTERRIYVFDRDHLDADPEEVAAALAITEEMVLTEPPLNPEDPLTSHLSLSLHNLATLRALITSIHLQHASLTSALSNLHRVNTGTASSFSLFLDAANPTMERYERLLAGWEASMDAVGRVKVVAGLLSRGGGGSGMAGASIAHGHGHGHGREGSTASASGAASAAGEKQRFLGDYVSRDKMLAVRDGCAKVLAELRMRTEGLEVTLKDVVAGTEAVQADLEATSHDLEDLQACEQDAEHGHLRIEELVQAGEQMTDPELQDQCFEELSVCDAEHRDRIRFLVERKNAMTRYLLEAMQKISTLQSDIASMPAELGALDHDLRTRTDNFKHLARLEGLIPAYIATVAEVVRRREYSRLLNAQSSTLSSTFAPLSATERTRRAHYRTTFSGKLPWEVRGLHASLDGTIPEMALSVPHGGQEGLPELGRETLDELGSALEELGREMGDAEAELEDGPVRKAKALLEGLRANVEELQRDFDQISLDPPPPRPPSIDPARLAELEAQVRQLEETNDTLSRQLQTERSTREEEVAQLESRCSAAEGRASTLSTRADSLEQDKLDLERARRDASARAEGAQRHLSDEVDRREAVERDLAAARAAEAELKKQWMALDLSHTRLQGEIGTVRLEMERVRAVAGEKDAELGKAVEKEREMAVAMAEKERELRDQRTEAELDRAVLEKQADELRKVCVSREKDVELAQGRIRTLEEVGDGLREQIARWEKVAQAKEDDVGKARDEVDEARREKERGIVDVQKELVRMTALARQAVALAGRLRDENVNITDILNTPAPPKGDAAASELDKAASPSLADLPPPPPIVPSLPPLDYANGDLADLVAELGKYTHDPLTDAVKNKVDGLTAVVKKWIKEAKMYRERAHRAASGANDKIAFRNFAKGDLALFLPTRNSAVPVWAAFNVSFPHHFLSATGVIADQVKTREWIVARITSLTEKVVDAKDPSSNPYLLAAGTKYFTLEVEPWSSKESSRSRRHSTADKQKKSSREARSGRASESSLPQRSLSTTDSAILVDRPSTSASTPNIRRSVSESGALPPNATLMARSEYAIVEVEEDQLEGDSRTSSPEAYRQRVPNPNDHYPESPTTTPSGIARALARSTATSPVENRSDPFTSASPTTNPFASASSPVLGSPIRRHSPTPPVTDYDPAHSSIGAAPAFLPSSGKKPHSAAGSTAGSSSTSASPRYIRSSARPIASRAVAHNPAADLLSGSPASTSASSVHAVSHPRSVSSGSSILSSSIHRRASSSAFGFASSVSPPMPGGKAPSTQEAQLTDSRWNLLQEDLAQREQVSGSSRAQATMTVGRKMGRGWPAVPSSSGSPSGSSPSQAGSSRTPSRQDDGAALSTSASSASIFDVLTGRKASGKVRRGSAAGSSKPGLTSAKGEMRKLLGQPPF
ncbi:hypothetical protein JCM10207_001163 [Rhodosporidiobolus poonsookiae]